MRSAGPVRSGVRPSASPVVTGSGADVGSLHCVRPRSLCRGHEAVVTRPLSRVTCQPPGHQLRMCGVTCSVRPGWCVVTCAPPPAGVVTLVCTLRVSSLVPGPWCVATPVPASVASMPTAGSGATCRCASVTRDISETRSPAATDQQLLHQDRKLLTPAGPVLAASMPSALTETKRPRAPATPASRAIPTSSASQSVPSTPTVPRGWLVSATSVWTRVETRAALTRTVPLSTMCPPAPVPKDTSAMPLMNAIRNVSNFP